MPALEYPHITHQNGEPARLDRFPSIRVAHIVADSTGNGWSTEEIIRQYPHLTAAEVHACLGYYYDHREEIDAEISALNAEFKHRKRTLPVVEATGKTILQADIDDALDD